MIPEKLTYENNTYCNQIIFISLSWTSFYQDFMDSMVQFILSIGYWFWLIEIIIYYLINIWCTTVQWDNIQYT